MDEDFMKDMEVDGAVVKIMSRRVEFRALGCQITMDNRFDV